MGVSLIVKVCSAAPVFCKTSCVPAGAPMQVGEKAKSWSCTVCVGPLGVQLAGAFEPEHETAPPQARTPIRSHGWMRIAGAYRPALAGGTSTTLDDVTGLAPLSPVIASSEATRLVARVPAVDAVGLEERAASLGTRSIKRDAKLWALDLAIRCTDLTTLEGSDTVGKIVAMCAKAVRPDPLDASIPSVAAVCIYPWLVPTAVAQLQGTAVHVASVAGGFPAGLGPLEARLLEIRDVVAMGADEVDIVLNRSLFLGGRYQQAFEELLAAREAAGAAHLKVILEVGELGSYDRVRQASVLAMAAGADFIKTSTGKIGVSATLASALCMMEAARDFQADTGRTVGIKVAGGVRKAKDAIRYLVVLHETLGADWMTPDRFRIGASSLLNDLLMQIQKERTGRYQGPDYFTVD
jgi:deoxyribose-phosphate aldolase